MSNTWYYFKIIVATVAATTVLITGIALAVFPGMRQSLREFVGWGSPSIVSHSPITPSGTPAEEDIAAIFSFDSPQYPWTDEENKILTDHLRKVYPVILEVYGDRYDKSEKILIKKDPNLSEINGMRNGNTITLQSLALETLTHEVIHAFRGKANILYATFEEGITIATQVEVHKRVYGESQRSFTGKESQYDFYNQQKNLGHSGGNIRAGQSSFNSMLRYQMAGYAWSKAYFEDPAFIRNFNTLYFETYGKDSSVQFTESKLIVLAEKVEPEVEGMSFPAWYASQSIFNTNPQTGPFIFIEMASDGNEFYLLDRQANGDELSIASNITMYLNYFDIDGNLLDHTSFGSIKECQKGEENCRGYYSGGYYTPAINPSYEGAYRIQAYAVVNGREIETVCWAAHTNRSSQSGILGVVPEKASGIIKAATSGEKPPVEYEIKNGLFFIPETQKARYEFEIVGTNYRQAMVKDSGNYFAIVNFAD